MQLREPYKPRSIRFLELWQPREIAGWRVKVYGIAYAGDRPPVLLVDAAKRLAGDVLAAARGDHYGVAFLGVHAGRDSDFAFVGWWADENELHHQVFIGPRSEPDRLAAPTPGSPASPIACAWDLALIGFERQAWIDAVLDNPHGTPDLDEYLRRTLSAAI